MGEKEKVLFDFATFCFANKPELASDINHLISSYLGSQGLDEITKKIIEFCEEYVEDYKVYHKHVIGEKFIDVVYIDIYYNFDTISFLKHNVGL